MVIDESVLHRRFGGGSVMREQLLAQNPGPDAAFGVTWRRPEDPPPGLPDCAGVVGRLQEPGNYVRVPVPLPRICRDLRELSRDPLRMATPMRASSKRLSLEPDQPRRSATSSPVRPVRYRSRRSSVAGWLPRTVGLPRSGNQPACSLCHASPVECDCIVAECLEWPAGKPQVLSAR